MAGLPQERTEERSPAPAESTAERMAPERLARGMGDSVRIFGSENIARFSGLYVLALFILVFAIWIPDTFLTVTTLKSVLGEQAITLVLALGLLIPLAAGQFDLSVAQNLGLGAMICAVLQVKTGLGWPEAALITIACGAVIGAVNGGLILFGVDSFIATLGMSSILLALTSLIGNNEFVGPLATSFQDLAIAEPFGFPIVALYAFVAAGLLWWLLEHTPMGRRTYATGANSDAARLAGVRTRRHTFLALVVCGAIASLAGVLVAAKVGQVSPTLGPPYLLPAFAACFLGTTQIKLGRFNVLGTVIAIFLLAVGSKGLQLAGGELWVTEMFNGVALVGAVTIAVLGAKRRNSRLKAETEKDGRVTATLFERSAEIRARNPLSGPNRLKLGVFGLNSIGCALTLVPEAYKPSWEGSLAAAVAADEAGFEAIVPYARWKSYVKGNVQHRSSQVMECFTWAAAIAARTSHSAIFATCHVPAVHPVLAAKQGATIDQISGGRFGLNVVAGWYAGELGMFGAELLDHEQRYAQAAEWTEIVQEVWSREVEVDHSGRWYEVEGAYFEPRPAQAPWPPIMNAGGSERGREFAARYSDMAFVMFDSEEPERIAASIESARALARDRYGRELQIWTPAYVVQAESDEEAARYVAHYGAENGDYEAADAFIEGMIETSSNLPPEVLRGLRLRIVEGGGGFPLVGTAATIAARMELLSECGLDGLLLSWIEYEPGIRRFAAEVAPLLARKGLRSA